MNNDVIITYAVTGAGDTTSRSNLVPITPRQVADAAIEAAKAGAAVVHVHVRDPETGQGQHAVGDKVSTDYVDGGKNERHRTQDGAQQIPRRPAGIL